MINYIGVRIMCSDRKLKTKIVRDKQVLKTKFVGQRFTESGSIHVLNPNPG